MRVLIVDDESLGRLALKELCRQRSDVEVIGECESGADALEQIRLLAPDLVLLDVQMKPMTGIDVAAALPANNAPLIVFVTAYDKYAVQAFEASAVDYLLKPVDGPRFNAAITRALARRGVVDNARQHEELRQRLSEVLQGTREPRGVSRLVLDIEGKVVFVDPIQIEYVESNGNYVTLKVGDANHTVRATLGDLEERLSANQFLRLSRSVIVNLNNIRAMEKSFHGKYVVETTSHRHFTTGRSYRDKVQSMVLRSRINRDEA